MAFDGQALNCIFDWWFYHGNPKTSIWLDYDGELFFYDSDRTERVARVMRLGDGPCFLDYDAKNSPFTAVEHCQIAKFVRINNAKFNN
ncbi:hypothetical protein [Lactobacillus delbrueckii]|uniref:hypothetical protein n=1 Tax=Lactobacillus delbrueckii TaxID=1584 RepID=UPI001E592376|nr:hypothetical protein [Lactobacillus delbrueckii]MCD5488351.1 hypothetical protein [Lactobacillus delbrueckii subsp. lactis]